MTYWNLSRYAPALIHARHAQEQGVREADAVVRALSASLGLDQSAAVNQHKH